MGHLEVSAHLTVRPGCLEGFKRQAAELIRITREKDVSQPLLDLLKTHAVGFTWFTFVQGLEPSPISPSRIPEVTHEAEQPM